jgi:hypothetical protein
MNYENDVERERVIGQALTARTLPEINVAAQELRLWLKEHPDDLNAEDALEPLAMLRQGMQAEMEVTVVRQSAS